MANVTRYPRDVAVNTYVLCVLLPIVVVLKNIVRIMVWFRLNIRVYVHPQHLVLCDCCVVVYFYLC